MPSPQYEIRIKFISDTLIGSGEGFGSIIDTDVVFDDLGLPFIPGRRIKGCLRESANDVCHMLAMAKISLVQFDERQGEYAPVVDLFGKPGAEAPARITFFNFSLNDIEDNQNALTYLFKEFPGIVTRDAVIQYFTRIRQQTAIDAETGTAKRHALRTIRVVNRGFEFSGEIILTERSLNDAKSDEKWSLDDENLLALACLNLRRIGSKRNRGLGEIDCRLFKDKIEVNVLKELRKA